MEYFSYIQKYFNLTEYTDANAQPIEAGADAVIKTLAECRHNIYTIGNGGSAAIASHTTIDLINSCGLRAFCFSDASVLTCTANDYGYSEIYGKNIACLAEKNDILIAISSSGKSLSIINAVNAARVAGCGVITLSGFEPNNALRRLGDINVYVPARHYGYVELIHQIILHMATDTIKEKSYGCNS